MRIWLVTVHFLMTDHMWFAFLSNIAEQLIEKGLATALRHRRDDEDRSSDYDKLMAAEQAYVLLLFKCKRLFWV